jgi:hypothetical protein
LYCLSFVLFVLLFFFFRSLYCLNKANDTQYNDLKKKKRRTNKTNDRQYNDLQKKKRRTNKTNDRQYNDPLYCLSFVLFVLLFFRSLYCLSFVLFVLLFFRSLYCLSFFLDKDGQYYDQKIKTDNTMTKR